MGQNERFAHDRRPDRRRDARHGTLRAVEPTMTAEPHRGSGVDRTRPQVRFTPDTFEGIDLSDVPESLRPHVEAARRLSEKSLAESTLTSYAYAWQRWANWCSGHGFDPYDHSAALLKLWIIELSADPNDPDLGPGRLRPVSLGPALAAIDRAAKARGQAPPSHDPAVANLLTGIRRKYGMAPRQQRTALEADLLCDLAEHLSAPTYLRTRDAVAVALRGAGLSLGECSGGDVNGVRWNHIGFEIDSASIEVPSLRGHRRRSVRLTGEDLEWLRRLRALEADRDGRLDGERAVLDLTRQGVAGCLRRSLSRTPLRDGADIADSEVRTRVYAALAEPTNAQLRDLALLTVGWFSALRRSNLDLLRWSDITAADDGLDLFIRRSKNDQEGHGETVYIPAAGSSGLPCPVAALLRYAERIHTETGVGISGTEQPVFVSVDRHDHFIHADGELDGMSGGAIHAAVRRIVERAGIDPTSYGSHSLRAGFITSAFSMGISAADIQHTTKHKSLDVLMGYNRPNDRRRRSAAAQMHRTSKRSRDTDEPDSGRHRPPEDPPAAFMP